MTNEDLDQARAEKAFEQSKAGDLFTDIAANAARLAREHWVPEPVDLDLAEAEKIRENSQYMFGAEGHIAAFVQAIKRGRELAAAEAKPGVEDTMTDHKYGPKSFIISDFIEHLKSLTEKDWAGINVKVNAGRSSALAAAWAAAWAALRVAAWTAAWAAAWAAARDAVGVAAWAAARNAAWAAARDANDAARDAARGAVGEIQGADLIRKRNQPFFFLPMFGFADEAAVLAALQLKENTK